MTSVTTKEDSLLHSFNSNDGTKFEIVSILGKGGQGTVFLVNSNKFHKNIALKVVKLKQKKTLLYYINSIINMLSLSSVAGKCHDNIMCSYGIIMNTTNASKLSEEMVNLLKYNNMMFISDAVPDNNVYLLYEYIEGTLLTKLIDPRSPEVKLDLNLIKSITHQLLKVLVYMHSLGFAHLDIKPDNIILEKGTNNLKLIDVEFLCHINNLSCVATGISPQYSSPNLYNASFNSFRKEANKKFKDNNSYMLKADVFSAGLIIYELLMREQLLDSIFKFEKNGGRTELNIELPDHLNYWRPLIKQMVKKNYIERISSTTALNEFEESILKRGNTIDGRLENLVHDKLLTVNKAKMRARNELRTGSNNYLNTIQEDPILQIKAPRRNITQKKINSNYFENPDHRWTYKVYEGDPYNNVYSPSTGVNMKGGRKHKKTRRHW